MTIFKFFGAALLSLLASTQAYAQSGDVNLYTQREPELITPLLERFTQQTGIKVNTVFAKAGLAERIAAEGVRSPADLLLSVDVSTLTQAVTMGITQPIVTPAMAARVPGELRGANGEWIATSARARVIYASKARIADQTLTYEDLANPRFKGKLCTRSGLHEYNTGLIAAAIAVNGPEKAQAWLAGMRDNLAHKPAGGDRDVAKEIAAGQCDLGIGNLYYIGLMTRDANQKAWAEAVRVIVPRFADGRTHVNVSGLVLTKNAPNKGNALKLTEWLLTDAAQAAYASENFEYPVVANVPLAAEIAAFGDPRAKAVPLDAVAANRKAASELVERTAFDLGPRR